MRRVSKKHNHSIKIKAKGQRFSSGFDTTGGNAPLSSTRDPEKTGLVASESTRLSGTAVVCGEQSPNAPEEVPHTISLDSAPGW